MVDVPKCGLGWGSFLCSKSTERCDNCAVDGSPIVEEDAEDFLQKFLVGSGEWQGCVFLFSVLYFLAVFWFDMWVKLVLWAAGYGMVESHEYLLDVFQHGEVDFPLIVFSVEVNAEVSLAGPIMGDGAMLFEESHEVLRMRFAHIFDAKIVHAKCEAN